MAKLKKRADGRYQRKITLSDGRQKVVYGRTLAIRYNKFRKIKSR